VAEQLTVKIGADISGLDAGIREATKTVSGFGDTLKGAFLGGFGADLASRAFSVITTSVTDAIHALAEVDKIAGQTAAVIKSTGGAAGVTADQVAALADALERKTGIEAESIQKGQNLLLTFTNIKDAAGAGNDIFSQSTRIMADLATAMGGDASGAAIQLGKALNDPTQGIAALSRVGVTFTDAQKEQIKALQESGNLMGAQRIILAELRKEFGGSAEAAGNTFGGALDRAKNAVDSISEAMISAKVPMFTAALNAVADGAYAISDAITNGDIIGLINRAFGPGAKALIVGIGAAMASSLAPQIINVTRLAVTMGATYAKSAAAMVVANAPLIAAIAAISFAAYPFIKNWETVSNLFILAWRTIVNATTAAWRDITGGAKIAFEILSGNFKRVYADAVAFLIGPLGRSFKALFDRLPAFVKDAVGGIDFTLPKMSFSMGEIPGAGQAFAEFKDLASSAIDTVKGGLMVAKEQFSSTWSGLPGEIAGVMNRFTGSVASASAASVRSLDAVGAASSKMGDDSDKGHAKASKAAGEHAKALKHVKDKHDEFGDSFKAIFVALPKAIGMATTYLRALRKQKDMEAVAKNHEEIAKTVADATKKISDIDIQAKYWNDTSDKTAEKQRILQDAINTLLTDGLQPNDAAVATLRKKYDDLGTSQATTAQKTVDLGTALGAIGGVVGAVSGTLGFFGGSDSPLALVLTKVTEGIGLFNTWSNAIKTAGDVFTSFGSITSLVGSIVSIATAPITLITLGIGILIWAVHDAVKAFGGWPKVFTAVKIAFVGLGLGLSKVGEFIVEGVINTIGAAWTGLVNTMRTGANVIIDVVNAAIRGINALGGNMAEIGRFDMIEFKPVELGWSKGFEDDMVKLQAEFAAAPPMQAWEVTNPLEEIKKMMAGNQSIAQSKTQEAIKPLADSAEKASAALETMAEPAKTLNAQQEEYLRGYNGLIQKALDAGNEAEARALTAKKEAERKSMLAEINAKSYKLQSIASPEVTPYTAATGSVAASQQRAMGEPVTFNLYYTGNGKWTREDAQALGALIVNEIKTAGVR
jgi:hypothetical protein